MSPANDNPPSDNPPSDIDDIEDDRDDVDSAASPRLGEVEGHQGMPAELVGGDHNLPGSQDPPPEAEPSDTPITDAKHPD